VTRGRRVKAARAYAGINQDTLAAVLGVSVITLKRYETQWRDKTFTDAQLERIAEVTGVPPWFLFDGFDEGDSETEDVRRLARMVSVLSDLVVKLATINTRATV
jgi:transcriptional regulator with XRE-family HTH domain